MTKTKIQSQSLDTPPDLIRKLMILAAIGLVSSFSIGLMLKQQSLISYQNQTTTPLNTGEE